MAIDKNTNTLVKNQSHKKKNKDIRFSNENRSTNPQTGGSDFPYHPMPTSVRPTPAMLRSP